MDDAAGREATSPRWPLAVLAAMVVAGVAFAVDATSGQLPFFDDWGLILSRRGWTVDAFLVPTGEHLSAVPVLFFKIVYAIGGLPAFWALRLIVAILAESCAVLMYFLARPRLGPVLALVPAFAVAFVGQGGDNYFWAAQIGYDGALIGGLGAFLLFDRGTRRADIGAAALLTMALYSASFGLPVLVGAACEVLARRDRWRRLWVVAVPAAIYVAWWIPRHQQHFVSSNVGRVPGFLVDASVGALRAVTGLGAPAGAPLLAVGAIVIAGLLVARRREVLTPRLAGAVGMALSFGVLAGLARADRLYEAATPRYLFPEAIFLCLVMVELCRGLKVRRRWVAAAIATVVAVLAVVQVHELYRRGDEFRQATDLVRPDLAALELTEGVVAPNFSPSDVSTIQAGDYFAAIHEHGSPVHTPHDLVTAAEGYRRGSDRLMVAAERLTLVATNAPRGCRPRAETGRAAAPGSTVVVRRPGPLRIARFAAEPAARLMSPHGARWSVLRLPRDRSDRPWRVWTAPRTRICIVA